MSRPYMCQGHGYVKVMHVSSTHGVENYLIHVMCNSYSLYVLRNLGSACFLFMKHIAILEIFSCNDYLNNKICLFYLGVLIMNS